MADPVGVARTAVGVVSLGLQVYSGLKQYLDDFNSRDERVSIALAYLDQLKAAVVVIDAATHSLQAQHQAPADVVLSCLRSCLEFIPSRQSSIKGKMKQIKKKLEFPFQISSIEEIENSLKRIIDQLSIVLHDLELHSHQTISTNVEALGKAAKAQADVLARINTDSETIQKPMPPMPLKSVTKALFNDFESRVQIDHSVTNARLGVLESRTEVSSQTMTEVLNVLRHLRDQSRFVNREFIEKYLVGSLVSKPSLLRDVHKSFDLQQNGIKPPPNLHMNGSIRMASEKPRLCGCSSWRRVKQSNSRWHAFDFFSTERQRTFGITYVGLRRLLSIAYSMSVSLNSGAGGTSISPIFRYYNMVDTFQSLPFHMIRTLIKDLGLKRLFRDGLFHHYRPYDIQKIATGCVSWIRVAYDRDVASPRDVSSHGLTLIDYFVQMITWSFYSILVHSNLVDHFTISALFELGVGSMQHHSLLRKFKSGFVSTYESSYLGSISSLLLRKAPECQYQWHSKAINLQLYGDLICQSSEISAAVELELDSICIVLLNQDINGISKILATKPRQCTRPGQYKLTKSLVELAVRWPVGLNRILEMEPRFFNSDEIVALFHQATVGTGYLCKEEPWRFCNDCSCSESLEILLKHSCALTSQDISHIFEHKGSISMKARHAVLRHLNLWRRRLRECQWLYQSVSPRDQLTVHEPSLLDYEAPQVVQSLQSTGLDLFKMFGQQQDDYRFGCSVDGACSIYFIVRDRTTAQMVFDLGFRDIDVSFRGVTPLSETVKESFNSFYCQWLIDKGADYTRESAWTIEEQTHKLNIVSTPRYSIMHWVFWHLSFDSIREVKLKPWVSRMVTNPCFPHFTRSSYYDGCSCACLSSPQGCSPFSVYFNQIQKERGLLTSQRSILKELIDTFHVFGPCVDKSSTLVESALRCHTFHRLGIRHTCCVSIAKRPYFVLPADYGSEFDELREEDEYRVRQLNELVTDFMDRYNNGTLTLKDFINGPWAEQMDQIEAEERKKTWTTQEKDLLQSISVLPEDEPIDVDENDETETEDSLVEDENEDEDEDKWLQPGYWNRQFEIIANGGRSEEENGDFYESTV
ncbi:hypothetical protein F4801DRAFT_593242 [Xylaria longipes]|nr:hypothetical protein F4801DRAFT_593242 [Xylaria longipes]